VFLKSGNYLLETALGGNTTYCSVTGEMMDVMLSPSLCSRVNSAKHLGLAKNNRIIPAAGPSEILRSTLAGRRGDRIGQFESIINGR